KNDQDLKLLEVEVNTSTEDTEDEDDNKESSDDDNSDDEDSFNNNEDDGGLCGFSDDDEEKIKELVPNRDSLCLKKLQSFGEGKVLKQRAIANAKLENEKLL
ncbi:3254_t:CDS:2, partial [Dentiscutata erythropus]